MAGYRFTVRVAGGTTVQRPASLAVAAAAAARFTADGWPVFIERRPVGTVPEAGRDLIEIQRTPDGDLQVTAHHRSSTDSRWVRTVVDAIDRISPAREEKRHDRS